MASTSHIFRADIKETDTTYEVEVDVPGMDKKIFNHYINNQLIVQGKRSADKEIKEENYSS